MPSFRTYHGLSGLQQSQQDNAGLKKEIEKLEDENKDLRKEISYLKQMARELKEKQ